MVPRLLSQPQLEDFVADYEASDGSMGLTAMTQLGKRHDLELRQVQNITHKIQAGAFDVEGQPKLSVRWKRKKDTVGSRDETFTTVKGVKKKGWSRFTPRQDAFFIVGMSEQRPGEKWTATMDRVLVEMRQNGLGDRDRQELSNRIRYILKQTDHPYYAMANALFDERDSHTRKITFEPHEDDTVWMNTLQKIAIAETASQLGKKVGIVTNRRMYLIEKFFVGNEGDTDAATLVTSIAKDHSLWTKAEDQILIDAVHAVGGDVPLAIVDLSANGTLQRSARSMNMRVTVLCMKYPSLALIAVTSSAKKIDEHTYAEIDRALTKLMPREYTSMTEACDGAFVALGGRHNITAIINLINKRIREFGAASCISSTVVRDEEGWYESQEVRTLKGHLELLKKEKTELVEKLATVQSERDKVLGAEKDLEAALEREKEKDAKASELRARLVAVEQEWSRKNEELRKELKAREIEARERASKVKEVEETLERYKKSSDVSNARVMEAVAEIANLEDHKIKFEALQAETQSRCVHLESELGIARERIRALESDADSNNAKTDALRRQLSDLERIDPNKPHADDEALRNVLERDSLLAEKVDLATKLEEAQQQRQEQSIAAQALQAQLEAAHALCKKLESEHAIAMAEASAELEVVKTRLAEVQEERSAAVRRHSYSRHELLALLNTPVPPTSFPPGTEEVIEEGKTPFVLAQANQELVQKNQELEDRIQQHREATKESTERLQQVEGLLTEVLTALQQTETALRQTEEERDVLTHLLSKMLNHAPTLSSMAPPLRLS
ncbi:putative myosin type-2 heavy chain protein [Pseudohyphozyma bogoriensis]|nr:putative myosin type-2 heavy chain protein [Pseudohyphozyma bogoriensis]